MTWGYFTLCEANGQASVATAYHLLVVISELTIICDTVYLMLFNDRGFSPLLILIVATVVLIIVAGGAYFFQRNESGTKPTANLTPISSIPPDQTPTPLPSAIVSPTPSPTPNSQPLSFSGITQPTCTSTSCTNTTVLIITGSGFSANTQLSATGQTNGNPYTGVVSQVNSDGTQIYFDLLNLPCQAYTSTLTNPMPTTNSVTFKFAPNKCSN